MVTYVATGFSDHADPETAAKEAAFQAKSDIKEDRIELALVFSSADYDPQLTLPVIRRVLNRPKLVGCSSAGMILPETIQTNGIAVLAISSSIINFGIGSSSNINPQNMHAAGSELAREALKDFGSHRRQVFIFFVDGQLDNYSLFLKGIQDVLGNIFPIVGAGSCDSFQYKDNFQFFEDTVLRSASTGLLLGGNMSVGVGVHHGWRPLGKPRFISRCKGNIIQMINNKAASILYHEYFGDEIAQIQTTQLGRLALLYPLGVYVEGSDEYLLRNAIDILDDGSIVCQGDVPQGSRVHIMIGNKDSCKNAALQAAQEAKKNLLGKNAKLILVIESMARLKLLGRETAHELEMIQDVFPNIPIFGMYARGEISPLQTEERFKKPHLQNESIVVIAIS